MFLASQSNTAPLSCGGSDETPLFDAGLGVVAATHITHLPGASVDELADECVLPDATRHSIGASQRHRGTDYFPARCGESSQDSRFTSAPYVKVASGWCCATQLRTQNKHQIMSTFTHCATLHTRGQERYNLRLSIGTCVPSALVCRLAPSPTTVLSCSVLKCKPHQGALLLAIGPLLGMPFLSTPMVAAHTYVSAR